MKVGDIVNILGTDEQGVVLAVGPTTTAVKVLRTGEELVCPIFHLKPHGFLEEMVGASETINGMQVIPTDVAINIAKRYIDPEYLNREVS